MGNCSMNVFLDNLTKLQESPSTICDMEDNARSLIEIIISDALTKEMIEEISIDTINIVGEMLNSYDDRGSHTPGETLTNMVVIQKCVNNLKNLKASKTDLSINLF